MTDTQQPVVTQGDKIDLSAMHRSEVEATVVSQAKLIESYRSRIVLIADSIEDEGDRSYFGSTNDADDLRALVESLTDSGNELFMPWMNGRDLYADLRHWRTESGKFEGKLRTTLASTAALQAQLDMAVDALEQANERMQWLEEFKAGSRNILPACDAAIDHVTATLIAIKGEDHD